MKFDAGMEGSLKNNNLYNDKELWDDADLDWYDYGFRNYDPQIGRFMQLDPLTDDYPELTNYQYASNDPIGNVDVDGLEGAASTVANAATNAVTTAGTLLPGINIVAVLPKVAKASSNFFSHVGSLLKTVGKNIWKSAGSFLKEANRRASFNFNKDVAQVKAIANQLNANAKANWASGNTLIQQVPKDFMENPLQFLEGGGELDVLKGVGVESESLSKYEIRTIKTGDETLPSLDATGKVHGDLPKIKDLGKYSKEALESLLNELKQSVKKRIEVTSKMGRDRAHGLRQGAEQDLIKAIEKHLQNR